MRYKKCLLWMPTFFGTQVRGLLGFRFGSYRWGEPRKRADRADALRPPVRGRRGSGWYGGLGYVHAGNIPGEDYKAGSTCGGETMVGRFAFSQIFSASYSSSRAFAYAAFASDLLPRASRATPLLNQAPANSGSRLMASSKAWMASSYLPFIQR